MSSTPRSRIRPSSPAGIAHTWKLMAPRCTGRGAGAGGYRTPRLVMPCCIGEHYADIVENGTGDRAYRRAVGMRIRVWRVVHDRSQDQLAAEAGVTRNFVSAIERG